MMSRSDSTVDASIVEGSPSPTTPSSNNDLSSANVDGQIQSPNVSSDPTLSLARNPSEGSPPPPRRSSRVADGIKQPARYNVSPPWLNPKGNNALSVLLKLVLNTLARRARIPQPTATQAICHLNKLKRSLRNGPDR